MRVLLQRVTEASVMVDDEISGSIESGMLILLGVEAEDGPEDIDWLVQKISKLRIYSDSEGKMNLSIVDVKGSFLVVSQFTLHASTKKGNRPSFIKAARPDYAESMYEAFMEKLHMVSGLPGEKGVFGGDMKVRLLNDGPVTIWMDSKNKE